LLELVPSVLVLTLHELEARGVLLTLHVVLPVEADHGEVHMMLVQLCEALVGIFDSIVHFKLGLEVVQELGLITTHDV